MCEKLGQPLFETVSVPDEVRTRKPLTMPEKIEEKDCTPVTIAPATAPGTAGKKGKNSG